MDFSMSWKMHDKEYESVVELPSNKRYEYFVKKVADWGEVWGLKDASGWVVLGDEEENVFIPVWPHQRFADAYSIQAQIGASPCSIQLDDWLEKWLPGMKKDQRYAAVFPVKAGKSIPVDPDQLKADIEAELRRFG
jgi:hypothetical protein